MKLTVNQTAYVDGHVGTLHVPDDATPEQIEAAVHDFYRKNDPGGLCHHCSDNLGDMSDTALIVEDEAGTTVMDTSRSADLLAQLAQAASDLDTAKKFHAVAVQQRDAAWSESAARLERVQHLEAQLAQVRGEVQGAAEALDVSSALVRQHVHAALDLLKVTS